MSTPTISTLDGRALRRLQARMASKPSTTREFDRMAPWGRLLNSSPHMPGEKTTEHIKNYDAFARLTSGNGTTEDFDRVAMVINMAKVRALQIDATLADMLERAQDAMARCKARYLQCNRFGFDGPGLQQVRDAMDAAKEIIDASSPLQMRHARDVVADAILGKGAAKRLARQAQHSQGCEGV
jgi:hypothetical protein